MEQALFFICIGGAVALTVYFFTTMALGGDTSKLRDRLTNGAPNDRPDAAAESVPLWQKVGQVAAEPFMPKSRETQSGLRKRLAYAGVYSPAAIKMMAGFKMIFLVLGVGAGYLVGTMSGYLFMGLSLGGLVGYLLPMIWLKTRIKGHQKALTYGLADALDLMVVCVEAGLTIDAAMQRVGQELVLAHAALSREFGIAHMETRVGLSRMEALKNLGQRTGNAALQSMASMLIQADRFGTSIASALRIHADTLRINRQHAAEELAAKASVKMSFPLVLFIFPATFIVLAGPTVIGLMNSALFK